MGKLEQFLNDVAPQGDWQPLIDYINKNYISKDKIRAKISELEVEKEKYFEKQVIQGRIDLLKELLEENNND